MIITMQQEHRGCLVKPLLILTLICTAFSIAVVVTLSIQGYTGFGSTYTASTTCNTYLTAKYETQKAIGHQVRFIFAIIAMLCLIMESIFIVQSFLKIRKIQQPKISQTFQWTQHQINLKYICLSLPIILLLPIFTYYFQITVQEGQCFHTIYVNWLLILIESGVSLILAVVCIIIIIKLSLEREDKDEGKNKGAQINVGELRQKQAELKNVFEFEGSELYRTIKRQNRDATEPLLVENNPIPLPQSRIQPDLINLPKFSKMNQIVEEVPTIVPQNNNPPLQLMRKKSPSPKKQSNTPFRKKKFLEMIQQKKNKFRQINPLKQITNKNKNDEDHYPEQNYEQLLGDNKMKNLPRPFIEYIKQAKKPRRPPPNISFILEAFNQAENARMKAQLAQEQKPFLSKYRKSEQVIKEQKIKDDQYNEQIEFIDEDMLGAMISQSEQNKPKEETVKASNQPQLFFHKPRMDKMVKKRRKVLFQEEVVDANQLKDEKESKDLIINKIKNNKAKNSARIQQIEPIRSPRRRNMIKSKQQIMLTFLKSKFSTPEEVEVSQAESDQLT